MIGNYLVWSCNVNLYSVKQWVHIAERGYVSSRCHLLCVLALQRGNVNVQSRGTVDYAWSQLDYRSHLC